MKTYVLRLKPNQDLKKELLKLTLEKALSAGVIVTGVGSLKWASLRLAETKQARLFEGPFEILSLSGTLCAEGMHLHINIADKNGQCLGGHLMDNSVINTTAEIVIADLLDYQFHRVPDSETGFKELQITKNNL